MVWGFYPKVNLKKQIEPTQRREILRILEQNFKKKSIRSLAFLTIRLAEEIEIFSAIIKVFMYTFVLMKRGILFLKLKWRILSMTMDC